jgi:hypothetical protein
MVDKGKGVDNRKGKREEGVKRREILFIMAIILKVYINHKCNDMYRMCRNKREELIQQELYGWEV